METVHMTPIDYSGIDSSLRFAIFDGCRDRGLQGEALEAEYFHQLQLLLPRPLAEAALSNMTTVWSTSEMVAGDITEPSRTIVNVKDKS
jgi:hypothetical protein